MEVFVCYILIKSDYSNVYFSLFAFPTIVNTTVRYFNMVSSSSIESDENDDNDDDDNKQKLQTQVVEPAAIANVKKESTIVERVRKSFSLSATQIYLFVI